MKRRRYLATLGAAGAGSLAGCGGLFGGSTDRDQSLVQNPPDAVYVPTHVEGMEMVGMASADRLRIALSYSFPHRFWTMDSDRTNLVEIGDGDVHMMVSVRDAETGAGIPSSNASLTVTRNGSQVDTRSAWPMLSQKMGFHYGDNVALEGDGTYEVEVTFGPVGTRRTAGMQGAFGQQVTRSFTMEYSEAEKEAISYTSLADRQGQRDAAGPMEMEMMTVPQLPTADQLPGTSVGQGSSGDATIVATVLAERPAGIEGTGPYLAVSPRTPYNRYPLPFTSLDASITRGGQTVFDGQLTETLDPDLNHHYGAAVESVQAGDTVTITPLAPPQVARHEGYETAFIEMSPVELTY